MYSDPTGHMNVYYSSGSNLKIMQDDVSQYKSIEKNVKKEKSEYIQKDQYNKFKQRAKFKDDYPKATDKFDFPDYLVNYSLAYTKAFASKYGSEGVAFEKAYYNSIEIMKYFKNNTELTDDIMKKYNIPVAHKILFETESQGNDFGDIVARYDNFQTSGWFMAAGYDSNGSVWRSTEPIKPKVIKKVVAEGAGKAEIKFGSDTKSAQKLSNQMTQRGWTESTVRDTVSSSNITRVSTNKATGNPATVYYNKAGGYVIVDNTTKAVVQVSDNINPSTWIPDPSIINPYKP